MYEKADFSIKIWWIFTKYNSLHCMWKSGKTFKEFAFLTSSISLVITLSFCNLQFSFIWPSTFNLLSANKKLLTKMIFYRNNNQSSYFLNLISSSEIKLKAYFLGTTFLLLWLLIIKYLLFFRHHLWKLVKLLVFSDSTYDTENIQEELSIFEVYFHSNFFQRMFHKFSYECSATNFLYR